MKTISFENCPLEVVKVGNSYDVRKSKYRHPEYFKSSYSSIVLMQTNSLFAFNSILSKSYDRKHYLCLNGIFFVKINFKTNQELQLKLVEQNHQPLTVCRPL